MPSANQLTVIGDRFLCKAIEADSERRGILLPDTVNKNDFEPQMFEVVSVGRAVKSEDPRMFIAEPGDRIYMSPMGVTQFKLEDGIHFIVPFESVLAVIAKQPNGEKKITILE